MRESDTLRGVRANEWGRSTDRAAYSGMAGHNPAILRRIRVARLTPFSFGETQGRETAKTCAADLPIGRDSRLGPGLL
jgi:hypothetical protein